MEAGQGTPIIQPGQVDIAGAQIEIALDVNPQQYPNGMEFLIMVPGQIEPLGKMLLRGGCMLAVVPPEMAKHIRSQVRQSPTLAPGHIDAPGIRPV